MFSVICGIQEEKKYLNLKESDRYVEGEKRDRKGKQERTTYG
jgi:hypothetical protein